jgi:hypothetical protein
MGVFLAQGTNHSHADEFCIKICDGIGILGIRGSKFLDFGHAIFNPGNEGAQGLIRLLPDREEVIPGIETRPRTLLEVCGSKGGPDLDRIILNSINVHPLFYRTSQIQLSSCLVSLDIPLGLCICVSLVTDFCAIDQQPEALDSKVGLHLTLPGSIVAGSELGDRVDRFGVFGHDGDQGRVEFEGRVLSWLNYSQENKEK